MLMYAPRPPARYGARLDLTIAAQWAYALGKIPVKAAGM